MTRFHPSENLDTLATDPPITHAPTEWTCSSGSTCDRLSRDPLKGDWCKFRPWYLRESWDELQCVADCSGLGIERCFDGCAAVALVTGRAA